MSKHTYYIIDASVNDIVDSFPIPQDLEFRARYFTINDAEDKVTYYDKDHIVLCEVSK